MTAHLITCFFREEFLMPLFTVHYHWCDAVTFITDQREDGKFDDEDKQGWINKAISESQADWIVLVDMDEFIYPEPYGTDPRKILEQEAGDVIYSHMTRMWRHRTDRDIDQFSAPVPQRLHGQKDHIKPCVFRKKGVITMGAGNHDIHCSEFMAHGKPWAGAHWANADACFWIDRETRDRGPRLSERNRQRGHGTHTLRTREQILCECEAHLDDPIIIDVNGAGVKV